MKVYENDFVYGRELLKKIMIAAVICCAGTIVTKAYPALYVGLFALAVIFFLIAFWIIYKHCRCPHCGKVIFLGVLALEICPKCKYNLITGKKAKKSKR